MVAALGACGSVKENVPPSARGIAVRKQSTAMKRHGGSKKAAVLRTPLRDTTGLVLAALSPAGEGPAEAARAGAPAAAVAVTQGRRSLRRGFR
jgi:hypothetical protein